MATQQRFFKGHGPARDNASFNHGLLMSWTIDPVMVLAYAWFAWVGAVTPGPNTMIALSCGIHFGRASIAAHLIGVVVGVSLMMLLMLNGAQVLIDTLPAAAGVLRWLGVLWLLWMGLQLARTRGLAQEHGMRPPRVWESAMLQWANPKAWMVISGTAATWRGIAQPSWLDALLLTSLFAGSCALALVLWAGGGERLSNWLQQGERLHRFNLLMGVSLCATAIWLAIA